MDIELIRQLLKKVKQEETSVDDALDQLKSLPYADLDFARVDHHRALRRGFPEVIYGLGKTPEHLAKLFAHQVQHHKVVLCTLVNDEQVKVAQELVPDCVHDSVARMLYHAPEEIEDRGRGLISVISAGTADLPIAQEAYLTARLMGNRVDLIMDVGISGLHRLLGELERIKKADVLVIVAGMEGALPSVVGGLCDIPIIAVPTSIGYGTGKDGQAALLSMLNSCVPGISVVNVDNGFGAGYSASLINRKRSHPHQIEKS